MTSTHTPRPVLLETRHLTRSVGGTVLVADISFQLHAGEIVALVGPSGAGKTSLLRLLNRLDEPTHGAVLLAGQDYRTLSPRELRRQVALVMQQPHLFPGTVADNIRFGPRQHGLAFPDADIDRLLEQVGLGGYASRAVNHLSGGEAQRVALLRALANQPRVLLLDEPTSALDAASAQAVETLVQQRVRQGGLACLLISHQPAHIDLADRTLRLVAGKLADSHVPQEAHDAASAYS